MKFLLIFPSSESRVTMKIALLPALCSLVSMLAFSLPAEEPAVASATETLAHTPAGSRIDIASGPDWRQLVQEDFANVNSWDDTWSFTGSTIACTGKPVSVIRSKEQFTNFELVCEWRHLKKAGNSGIFLWTIPASLEKLAASNKPGLPQGIEVQVLDLGYKEAYEQGGKRKADWFTCHGDVFPVGAVDFTPFPPVAPNGKRSFPTKELSRGVGEWNHYYVRALNGEVRLWVNGEEVSGGTGAKPCTGYLCLESEGSPVEFRNLRVRNLPSPPKE